MPKMLIVETTVVNYGDDRGGVVETAGTQVSVPKEAGAELAKANRALYLDKSDDFTREWRYTATPALVRAAKAASAASEPKQPAGGEGGGQ